MESTHIKFRGSYKLQCFDSLGNLKWQDECKNLVTNEGLNHILASTLDAQTQITSWYVGLNM
jgi:hypothetical protein